MLKISVNNTTLELLEKLRMTWLFRSPLFNEYGSRTDTINIPLTDANNKTLGFPGRHTKKERTQNKFQTKIEFGSFQKTVSSEVQEVNEKLIQILNRFDKGSLNDLIGEKSLKDIDYGDDYNIGADTAAIIAYLNAHADKQYPDVNFNFPMLATPNLYGKDNENNAIFHGYANYYEYYSNTYLASIVIDGTAMVNHTIIPCFFAFHILKKVLLHFGYTLKGTNLLNNAELNQLMIINNQTLDLKIKALYCFVGMTDIQNFEGQDRLKLDDESSGNFEDIGDLWDIALFEGEIKEAGLHTITFNCEGFHNGEIFEDEYSTDYPLFNLLLYVDGVIVAEIHIEKHHQVWKDHEISYTGFYNPSDIGKKIWVEVFFDAAFYSEETQGHIKNGQLIISNNNANNLCRYTGVIKTKNHLPNWEIKSFLQDIQLATGSIFIPDDESKTITAHMWDDILNSRDSINFNSGIIAGSKRIHSTNRTGQFRFEIGNGEEIDLEKYNLLPSVNTPGELPGTADIDEVILVKRQNIYYKYQSEDDQTPTWEFLAYDHRPYIQGDEDENTHEKAYSFSLLGPDSNNITHQSIPLMEDEGYSVPFGMDNKDIPAYLLFYRGLHANLSGYKIPLATYMDEDIQGSSLGNYSLLPAKMAQTLYAKYIAWVFDRISVEYKKQFTPAELKQISYTQKKRIAETNFLIDSVEVPMLNDSLGEAKIKLYSV